MLITPSGVAEQEKRKNRDMQEIELFTRVGMPTMPFGIDFSTGIVSLGSCFSDEIGTRLRDGGFHVEQNPFGTLYNPASIASALRRMMYDKEIGEEDLVEHEGLWHSWYHHGSFSRTTKEACLEACNSRLHQAHEALKEARLLMITFGTAWVYGLVDKMDVDKLKCSPDSVSTYQHINVSTHVVANCHKLPQNNFVRRKMSVEDIVTLWRPLLEELHASFPELKVLFTVSPIRHIGDGLHGNQLSKSTLLLAVDELVSIFNSQFSISYFPSYEIVLDELRDYRYYGPDMTHPSALAVDVVWDRFQRVTMTPAVREQAHVNAKRAKRERHLPLFLGGGQ